jgi:hypothetical protein
MRQRFQANRGENETAFRQIAVRMRQRFQANAVRMRQRFQANAVRMRQRFQANRRENETAVAMQVTAVQPLKAPFETTRHSRRLLSFSPGFSRV